MIARKIKVAVGVGVLALATAPGTASAVSVLYSYQGSDFSMNSSDGKTMYACDKESDGHDVSADFVRTGSTKEEHVIDGDGGSCASTSLATVVYKHRSVELLPLTDAYGPWKYPS